MKNLSLLFVFSALTITSCSPKRSSGERTTLGVRMPEVSSLQAITPAVTASTPYINTGIWGLETPTNLSEIDCFGVAVTFPEETNNSCHLLDGGSIDLDEMFGTVGAGSLLQADITSGEARYIQVFGFATVDGTCPKEVTNLTKAQMSQSSPPVILGGTLIDVEGESMEVEVGISMNSPIVVNDCAGDWYAWEEGTPTSNAFNIENGYLTVVGDNLGSAHSAKVVDASGNITELYIESKNNNGIAMKALSALDLAVSSVYEIFISNAYGQAIFNITVGGTSAGGIPDIGAAVGETLVWDGTAWVATNVSSGQVYSGSWDPTSAIAPNLSSPVNGEYYIVSVAGTSIDIGDGSGVRDWAIGDWIIYNSSTNTWDKIDNSNNVQSFNGRIGVVTPVANDYTWAMIDKSVSTIDDISDIDLSTPATTGQVLKFNGTTWTPSDDLAGGGAASVTSTEIADASIVDADISATAAIAWSKIDKTGVVPADVGLGNLTNDAQIPLSFLDINTALGVSDSAVPSQNAVKVYVDSMVSGAGTVTSITGGMGLSNGPITTSGTLDINVDDVSVEVISDILQVKDGGINSMKIADGSIMPADIANVQDTQVMMSCSDGQILKNNLGALGCTSSFVEMSGMIGIGMAIPARMLDVMGDIGSSASIYANSFLGMGGGSASSPSYSFDTDMMTGFFSPMPNVIGVSLGGTTAFKFDGGRLISPASAGAAIVSNTGSATAPTYSFATYQDTGMYLNQASGALSFSMAGMDKMVVDATGNIGIGTNAPAYNLEVAGTIAGTNAYTQTSDIRYKKDFERVNFDGESALEKIAKLNGYYYYWRLDDFPEKSFKEGRDLGVIAQEVEEVFPEVVNTDRNGFKSVAYSKLISPIIEAIKELFAKGEADKSELKRELASVKEENQMMKSYLCAKDPYAPFCE